MSTKHLVLLLVVFFAASCTAEDVSVKNSDRSDFKKSFAKECVPSYSIKCLKLHIVQWVDKLDENEDLSVLPGVSVVRENVSESADSGDIVKEVAREFPNDPDARLDAYLMKKITGYLNSHSVKLNLWSDSVGEARGKGGGGGGGGGKKGGGGGMEILAMGAMMKATLYAIALKGVALIAGKALMVGLIALVISKIIALKALTHHGGGEHHQTVEVVAKPHEDHGWYGHSSHGRSFDKPLPLGLQPGYKPT